MLVSGLILAVLYITCFTHTSVVAWNGFQGFTNPLSRSNASKVHGCVASFFSLLKAWGRQQSSARSFT